jgi:hypothetical protein
MVYWRKFRVMVAKYRRRASNLVCLKACLAMERTRISVSGQSTPIPAVLPIQYEGMFGTSLSDFISFF